MQLFRRLNLSENGKSKLYNLGRMMLISMSNTEKNTICGCFAAKKVTQGFFIR
jgi:hypothetical protein